MALRIWSYITSVCSNKLQKTPRPKVQSLCQKYEISQKVIVSQNLVDDCSGLLAFWRSCSTTCRFYSESSSKLVNWWCHMLHCMASRLAAMSNSLPRHGLKLSAAWHLPGVGKTPDNVAEAIEPDDTARALAAAETGVTKFWLEQRMGLRGKSLENSLSKSLELVMLGVQLWPGQTTPLLVAYVTCLPQGQPSHHREGKKSFATS